MSRNCNPPLDRLFCNQPRTVTRLPSSPPSNTSLTQVTLAKAPLSSMKPQGLASFKNPRLFREDSRKLPETPDQGIKKLAELKAYLEKRVGEHENEIRTLRSFLETVDNLLAERSYKRVDISQSLVETASKGVKEETDQVLSTMSGVRLAKLALEGGDLVIAPAGEIRFDTSAPPFRSFLVEKVL